MHDITRQRQAERERLELLEASMRAGSASRAKSEFLARMSHELRTPLNSIIGFSQVLQLSGLPPRQSGDVGHILRAGNHLLELVNEVLDLARIESGQVAVSPEPVALVDTIRDALTLVAPTARERQVSLAVNVDGLAPHGYVHADRNRLRQVILNLLSNAIKYNRSGGRVDITFQTIDTGRVRTIIADTGLGIQPARLDKLFEPFERLGAEQTEIEGTGLGLALSKGLIETMGGTIEVNSTVGIGSTFVVELARQHRPDLIILDLHLPDLPGAEVLRHLKAEPQTRAIPVIVLTADASGRQTERIKQLGAADYLTKPLDLPNFLTILADNHAATAWREP